MTTPMWFGLIAVALAILVPVLMSFVICVPKWWGSRVEPHLPRWLQDDGEDVDFSAWYYAPFRWVWAVFRFFFCLGFGLPLFVVGGLLIKYCYSWSTWVERKCPYNPGAEDEFDSYHNSEKQWTEDWRSTLAGIWRTALGRGS